MSFANFELHPKIFAGVQSLGYKTPTPIQLKSIPPVMKGRDVVGLAQTGTGKTAAFVLPILQRLIQGPHSHVRALIIAPTRELSEQTHEAIRQLGRKTKLRSASIYGGVSIRGQIKKLNDHVDIISACPGRLLDHVNRGTVDLSRIEVLVLDEADRMFDMGFLPDIRKIVKRLPTKRQTLLFSATMPQDVQSLANDLLQNPLQIKIGSTAPVDTVSHRFYPVRMDTKTELLKDILDHTERESVLIFTRTKSRAKSVAGQLDKSGYSAISLHGNLTQQKRQKALDGFRDGRYEIMVATDIAARGIDVRSISHVINYDMPASKDDYTHRIGRTGRASKTGEAFSFVTGQDAGLAHSLKRTLGDKLEYHSINGLTIAMPTDQASSPGRKRSATGMKTNNGNKKSFYPKTQGSRKPKKRSSQSAGRRSWSH
ncbi:MAG: DEAD/DEAH box helicase [Deltaproteobacteria bacterium]|nr:DEAD/DEAH box helicase [Deltaproteobacteria bacterium]